MHSFKDLVGQISQPERTLRLIFQGKIKPIRKEEKKGNEAGEGRERNLRERRERGERGKRNKFTHVGQELRGRKAE